MAGLDTSKLFGTTEFPAAETIDQALAGSDGELLNFSNQYGIPLADLQKMKTTAAKAKEGSKGNDPAAALAQMRTNLGSVQRLQEDANGPIDQALGRTITDKTFGVASQSRLVPRFLRGERSSGEAAVQQLKAAEFTTAIPQMKGLGALSNAEGSKLSEQASRLYATDEASGQLQVTQEEAASLITEMEQVIKMGIYRMENNIKVDKNGKVLSNPNDVPANPPESYDPLNSNPETTSPSDAASVDWTGKSLEEMTTLRANLKAGDPYTIDGVTYYKKAE